MNVRQAVASLVLATSCAGVARLLAARWIEIAPRRLGRVNVNGIRVPAVLGLAVVGGSLIGLAGLIAARSLWDLRGLTSARMLVAGVLVLLVLALAGLLDDLRGDEQPRGFKGHLRALRWGHLTGGIVKLAAGGAIGLVAGALIAGEGSFGLFGRRLLDYPEAGWADAWRVVEVGAFVALGANLLNLLDRAPGRATKAAAPLVLPCLLWANGAWVVVAAPLLGAQAGVFTLDLKERGMAGDAGVNPVGGMLGLGLATIPGPGRTLVLVLLLTLNVASEKWSFSRLIAARPWLRKVDRWGRASEEDDPSH